MMALKPFSEFEDLHILPILRNQELSDQTLLSRSDRFGSKMKMTTGAKRAIMKKIHRTSSTIFYSIAVSCAQYAYFLTNTSAAHRIAYEFDIIMMNIPNREWVL